MTDLTAAGPMPKKASSRRKLPVFVVLLLLAFTTVWPMLFVFMTSVRPKVDYTRNPYGLPSELTFNNFVVLVENYDVLRAAGNSLFVISGALGVVLVLATLAAYAIVKLDVPFKSFFMGSFVSVMLVPGQVLIIPIYLLLSWMRLVDNHFGVMLVYIASNLPFATFFMITTMRSVPDQLIESARLDGAGVFRILWSVVVPVMRTSILTLGVLTFLGMWNELIYALILLPSEQLNMLTPKIASIGNRFNSNPPVLMAGLVITSLPPVLILAFLSKYLVDGLSSGMGK
jgi:ABC-type glycerol-3-phosphate transport system permease component